MTLVAATQEPVWTLGDKLAKSRRLAHIEQVDMASLIGVSRALISKWERDVTEPNVSQARRWAEATGVSLEWLMASGYKQVNGVAMPGGQMELISEDPRTWRAPVLTTV